MPLSTCCAFGIRERIADVNQEAKVLARVAAKKRRAAAQASLGAAAAAQLADRFFEHIPLPPDAIVAGYMPIGSEADPSEIMRRAAGRGFAIALPCVEMPAAPLVFRLWTLGEALVDGPHGTREPAKEAPSAIPELVIVPLLAFDKVGRRLGYGGGYYDRTLASLREKAPATVAVGLAFSAQEVDELPEDGGDQRLDWVVTERDVRSFR